MDPMNQSVLPSLPRDEKFGDASNLVPVLTILCDSRSERHYLGTLGPFEIASRSHHGSAARLTYPATRILAAVAPDYVGEVTVSLVRVNGQNSPAGPTLTIGELRVEISADEIE